MQPGIYHVPVMLQQVIEGLQIKPDGVYVDCTFGGGGHSKAILQQLNTKGKLIESCFRAYQDIEASFKDHSDFLKTSPKYLSLFALDAMDYRSWANGLKACGYATDKSYAAKLIQTIEEYHLYRYDTFQSPVFDLPVHINTIAISPRETTID